MKTFILPKPISTNNLYANVSRGRVKTTRYGKWSVEAATMLTQQRARPMPGPYAVTIEAPASRRMDLDNTAKAYLDALQNGGVISNDNLVDRIVVTRSSGDLATVTVETIA